MGKKRRGCGRSNPQRKAGGDAWSEEEDDASNISQNGSNRTQPKIKVEIKSQDRIEEKERTPDLREAKGNRSERKRVLTQVNRSLISQLRSPPRRKYAFSPRSSNNFSSSRKSPPLVSLFNISGLSPISPVPIDVYDSHAARPESFICSPSKFGKPLKASTPIKQVLDHEDSLFELCVSPTPMELNEQLKNLEKENTENIPPKRKRGRPPGKKKKVVTEHKPKDPSTVTGAKRGRKPKPKPLQAIPGKAVQAIGPTVICDSTDVSVREPPPLDEGGELDVCRNSDPNPDVLPILCLVNNEKLETGKEEISSNEFCLVLEAVPEAGPLEAVSDTKETSPIHHLNPPNETVYIPTEELPPSVKSHVIIDPESPIRDNVITDRRDNTRDPIYFNSPIYCKVLLNDSGDELDYSNCESRSEETPHRYKLRPRRKIFPQALSLHRYQPDSDNEDSEEEFVLYVDDDSDEEDSACSDDFFEEVSIGNNDNGPRKSSYQGGRGPRADLKALSLVTSCPVSVQWLVDNFEYHLGKSLPRGFVYDQYVLLCDQHGLEPVNAASFGKLIRSVFPGLKTRRLGTRGNSKYHYNGVYLKPTSPLRTLFNALRTQQGLMYDGGKRGRRVRKPMDQEMLRELLGIDDVDDIPSDLPPEEYLGKRPDVTKPFSSLMIDPAQIPPGITAEDLAAFEKISYEHVSRLLLCFENFDLRGVTEELQRFWRVKCSDPNSQNRATYKQVLARVKLFKICTMPYVEDFIKSMDLFLYQGAIEILFPFLSREMPVTMHQGMRNFVKEIEIVMHKVLNGYPMKMCDIKMRCLRVFVSMWHDYSRLNKQVKSTCQILRSNESLRVMRSEFEKSINVEEVLEDEKGVVKLNAFSFIVKLIADFSVQLKDQEQSIDSWVDWAHCTTEKLLMESYRQANSKEVSVRPNAIEFWKAASDQIMGALAKWGSISIPHFKTFLSWCDHLISHMYKLVTATSEGFTLPSFYYFYHCLQPSTVPTIPRHMALKIGSAGKRGKNVKFSSVLATRRHRKTTKSVFVGKSESTDHKDMKSKASTSVEDQCDVITTGEEPENNPDYELFSFLDY